MRRLSVLLAIFSLLFIYKSASAQTNIKLDEDSILFNISTDVQDELRNLWPTPQNIKWSRQVYREIFFNDSTVANRSNSLLKFPDEPISSYVLEGGVNKLVTKQNLFWLLFKLALTHKVPVYQSNDYLTFTESDRIKSDSIILANLKYIPEAKGKFVVKDVYTRSLNSSILGYLIKENYYFDADVSELRSQIVAIAPLIESTTMGGNRDYTIPFWMTYESIAPWLINYTLMASENNNADVISFDTYFKKRLFKGSIIKIENPLNYTIAKECSNCCPDDLQECMKKKQGEVENQILSFDQKQLWAQPVVSKKAIKKVKKQSASFSKPKTSLELKEDSVQVVKTKPSYSSKKSNKSKKVTEIKEELPAAAEPVKQDSIVPKEVKAKIAKPAKKGKSKKVVEVKEDDTTPAQP